uniref:Uncharacterized protein n=1 Tax=Arundo donax TaxID=35708 RepID=A0A0A9DMY8_ARUDO
MAFGYPTLLTIWIWTSMKLQTEQLHLVRRRSSGQFPTLLTFAKTVKLEGANADFAQKSDKHS